MIEKRPWGYFEVLLSGEQHWIKRLVIKPGCQLSYQSHEKRHEVWTTADVGVVTVIDGFRSPLTPYRAVAVKPRQKHRIINNSDHEVTVLEWAHGLPEEDDITRYEDDYGRET